MAIIKHEKGQKMELFQHEEKNFSPLFFNYFPADADREF